MESKLWYFDWSQKLSFPEKEKYMLNREIMDVNGRMEIKEISPRINLKIALLSMPCQ
jgi:hypothetical protein